MMFDLKGHVRSNKALYVYNLFSFFKKIFLVYETNLKQINNKIRLVNLYKDIMLVTRVRIFCTALFNNNNIKVVIQIDAFLAHHRSQYLT